MKLPLQVSFRHMGHSAAIEGLVREKAAKLDEFAGRIMSCRVVVELKSRHHEHGNLYDVRINLTVPGEELSVTRTPDAHAEYRDIEIALHDAFDAAGRLLQDYVRRVRGDVKAPEQAPHGKISKLLPEKGYGFLKTLDGREIYFHKHSVLHGAFDRLEIGTEVAFAEEAGENGPQASTVRIVGRHGHL